MMHEAPATPRRNASGAPDNSSLGHFSAMTRPSWLCRAVRNRHRHAIERASRRWRGGRRGDSARTRRKLLISTQLLARADADVHELLAYRRPSSLADSDPVRRRRGEQDHCRQGTMGVGTPGARGRRHRHGREAVWKSKVYGAFVLNRRVVLHAIDATPARWRGDAGSSPLDGARTAASSPRNVDFHTGEKSARLDAAQKEILAIGKERWVEKVEETRMIRKMAGLVALGMSLLTVFYADEIHWLVRGRQVKWLA